ncbi:branched-chain amino acid ABC transporter permease [Candidatus Bipolaricaulota bacterium]|nr:branched-chain amino acid ABC transporter permease [Candidatus Bipolaricaulota bacterium]
MPIANFTIYLFTMFGIYALFAMSLNLQVGYAGLVNFGQVAFFALGAYTSALLVVKAGLPIAVGIIAGMLASGFFGCLLAWPTKSLKSDYWAITTLAAGEVIRLFALNEKWLTEGPFGVMNIPQPLEGLIDKYYNIFYFIFVLIVVAVVYMLLSMLTDSPFGRNLKAIRDAEDLSKSLGKNTQKIKVQVMAIGGLVAGLAGAIFAHYMVYISPENFRPLETFLIWGMIIVGGRANNRGAILGAVVIQTFYVSTRFVGNYVPIGSDLMSAARMIVIGLLMVSFLIFRPEGLLRERKKTYPDEV